jgi:Outer membrane protein beta-barrel domain
MKKLKKIQIILITIFLTIHTSKVQSQENINQPDENNKPIKIGAKIGYSLGKLSNTTDNIYTQNYESIYGIDWGVLIEFPINDLISVQTEINFTDRGGTRNGLQPVTGNELSDQLNKFLPFFGLPPITNENPLYATFDNKSILHYLEIPVLAKFGWGNNFRFYAEIGPYLGILLNAKQETSGMSKFYFDADATMPVFVPNPDGNPLFIELPEQSLDATTNVKGDLRTVNFGGIVGIGVIQKIGKKGELFVDARSSYTFGRIQINDDFGKSHIGAVIFSIGYTYTFNN